jgi:poly(ADP-ribose) glycohydrolase
MFCTTAEQEDPIENWEEDSNDTQPMSSVETETLLKQLESTLVERVLRMPSVINKVDMSQNSGKPDFDEMWENPQYVKFPCSNHNTYRLRSDPENYLSKWRLICDSLSAPISNAKELEDCILSYSPTFIGQWTFGSLHECCALLPEGNTFWSVILPFMAQLAQKLDKVFFSAIPLLRAQVAAEITLTHEQCACLISNMFFCTFPQRSCNSPHGGNGTGAYENFPNVNFNTLFATNESINRPNRRVQKLQCILHYFETLAEHGIPQGKVSVRRHVLQDEPEPIFISQLASTSNLGMDSQSDSKPKSTSQSSGLKSPNWSLSTAPLIQPDIHVQGTIEDDGNECWQVDFANMIIGGGVIGAGCVQEEIRFVINPECLVSRLLCEKLSPNESVLIIGPQRYSNYSGYRDTFAWSGHHEDKTPRDAQGRIQTIITAIDAVSFPFAQIHRQFSRFYIHRELNKAYIGFMPTEEDEASWPIASGHWGCGAFNGDKHLKAILQWMAASEAGRSLRYFAFGDEKFASHFQAVIQKVMTNNIRVGDLMQHTLAYRPGPKRNLFSWISHCMDKMNKHRPSL